MPTRNPEKRALSNRRYYIRRKHGITYNENFKLPKLEDQPKEIQETILSIRERQQKYPGEFYKRDIKTNCEVCGSSEDLKRHHIKYTPTEEVITVCYRCHCLIHGRILGTNGKESQREKWARQKRTQRERKREQELEELSISENNILLDIPTTYKRPTNIKQPDLKYIS